jgi:hypothetical protein
MPGFLKKQNQTEFHYVTQASLELELEILLPQPPKCWHTQAFITMPSYAHF